MAQTKKRPGLKSTPTIPHMEDDDLVGPMMTLSETEDAFTFLTGLSDLVRTSSHHELHDDTMGNVAWLMILISEAGQACLTRERREQSGEKKGVAA